MKNYIFIKLKTLAWVIFLVSSMMACSSKKGCIDPGSLTYNPDAKIDNGTCTYPSYTLSPTRITKLDNQFNQNSGLKYLNSRVWTILDDSGEDKVYSVDMVTGTQKEVLQLPGINSVDFEAVTVSDTHFFLADIGNNEGNRTDLTIYKAPIPSVINPVNTAAYEMITFNYPEQSDFRKNKQTNYDAEAIIHHNGYLYIFTKNHVDHKTHLYQIPAAPGNYDATLKGIFDAKGLITDADITDDGKKVVLIGYNELSGKSFLWVLKDFNGTQFFSGKKILVDTGLRTTIGQVEGVSFYDPDYIFITNEQYQTVDASLYYLDISSVL
jgi:hypothetical protein